MFAKTGGLPLPKRSPERRAYRLMDMKRWRDHLGMPVNLEPKHFPADDGPASRLVIAAKLAGKDAHALATEIGKALWEKEQNIAETAVLEGCARSAGLDAAAILKAAPPETELASPARRVTRPRPSHAASSARRATCWNRARSSGARTASTSSSAPWRVRRTVAILD